MKISESTFYVKYFLYIILGTTVITFIGCSKESDLTNNNDDDNPPTNTMMTKVEGRVAGAYCTYYSNTLPDPNYVTHINYAFAEVYVTNGLYKGFKLQGTEAKFKSVLALKSSYPSLKILLSFTNEIANSDNVADGGFSSISATDNNRKQFAADCVAFMKKWGIDGVDIDWEYPGLSWSSVKYDVVNDVGNFTLLMKQLRETFGTNYLLTYAGYVTDKKTVTGGYRYMDIAAVMPYVDYVNIMTYDLDSAPHLHSAMNDAASYWDCKRTIDAYAKTRITLSKLVMGIPFYGRHSFSSLEKPLAITYRNILQLDKSIYKIDNWNTSASVPYVSKGGMLFCSYDNAQSISLKGAYILGLGMKGMFCWESSQDDDSRTLTKALWNATMKH